MPGLFVVGEQGALGAEAFSEFAVLVVELGEAFAQFGEVDGSKPADNSCYL